FDTHRRKGGICPAESIVLEVSDQLVKICHIQLRELAGKGHKKKRNDIRKENREPENALSNYLCCLPRIYANFEALHYRRTVQDAVGKLRPNNCPPWRAPKKKDTLKTPPNSCSSIFTLFLRAVSKETTTLNALSIVFSPSGALQSDLEILSLTLKFNWK